MVKTISKFKEIARSGNIRDDGNLVIGADDSGLVQVRSPVYTLGKTSVLILDLLALDLRHQVESCTEEYTSA